MKRAVYHLRMNWTVKSINYIILHGTFTHSSLIQFHRQNIHYVLSTLYSAYMHLTRLIRCHSCSTTYVFLNVTTYKLFCVLHINVSLEQLYVSFDHHWFINSEHIITFSDTIHQFSLTLHHTCSQIIVSTVDYFFPFIRDCLHVLWLGQTSCLSVFIFPFFSLTSTLRLSNVSYLACHI